MWKIDIDSETETKQFEKSIPILRLRPRDVKNRYRYWDWDLGMWNFDIDIETETTKSHDIETISIISSSSGSWDLNSSPFWDSTWHLYSLSFFCLAASFIRLLFFYSTSIYFGIMPFPGKMPLPSFYRLWVSVTDLWVSKMQNFQSITMHWWVIFYEIFLYVQIG